MRPLAYAFLAAGAPPGHVRDERSLRAALAPRAQSSSRLLAWAGLCCGRDDIGWPGCYPRDVLGVRCLLPAQVEAAAGAAGVTAYGRGSLSDAWAGAVSALGGGERAARLDGGDLEQRYREPHRRYHTSEHIRAVLADAGWIADALVLTAADRAFLTLAACAHDVVYDARPGDDERASARWAGCALDRAGLGGDAVRRVEQLVLSTLAHETPQGDPVAAALLDADLAILGAEPEAYDRYSRAVRAEFSSVPDDVWRAGRRNVLSSLLGRGSIFVTASAIGRWESAARANVQRELGSLAA
jgi:predicted metal-dependent HD superfamily phosphohydrolase